MVFFIFLLDVSPIHKHHGGEILRRVGAVNGFPVSLFPQKGNASHMIHVRMTEYHGIDLFGGIKGECAVFHRRFFALALEESAIEEDSLPAHLQFMTRTGNLSGGAMGNNLHDNERDNRATQDPAKLCISRGKGGRAAPWGMMRISYQYSRNG